VSFGMNAFLLLPVLPYVSSLKIEVIRHSETSDIDRITDEWGLLSSGAVSFGRNALLLLPVLPYVSSLKIQVIRPSETSADFYRATHGYNPQNGNLH
jgi:hypothetical protein